MPDDAPLPLLRTVCDQKGWTLSAAQLERFQKFAQALEEHNQVKNLTRIPPEFFDARHFAESCLILDLIPRGAAVLDIGTGPGFPAWPLACARPDCAVTALDSNGKMLDFLRSQTLPNLTVVHARMEELDWEERFDVVTGRAVAPLGIQLELSAKPCKVGGLILPFRSQADRFEGLALDQLALELLSVRMECIEEGRSTVFPIYRKVTKTRNQYPRSWAKMKSKPLS